MPPELSPVDRAKSAAARRAVAFVEDGMRLGLGTGSTAAFMVHALAERVQAEGLDLRCVPTSEATATLARSLGLRLATLDEVTWLDLTIDGADEFDGRLDLIKGGGGALLREKIVATASQQMIVIADSAKEVATLGAFPLPLEVLDFGWRTTAALVEETLAGLDVMGQEVRLRQRDGAPFRTDQGNLVLDLGLRRIGNARQLALVLNQVPGVVENGLFLDVCDRVVIGHGDGRVELREATGGTVRQERLRMPGTENVFRDLPD